MHTSVIIHHHSADWCIVPSPLRWYYDSNHPCHNIHDQYCLCYDSLLFKIHPHPIESITHQYLDCMLSTPNIYPCCICFALFRIAMAHQCITRITPLCISHYSSDTACLLISIHSFICIWVHPPVYPTYTGQCVMHCWWLSCHLLSTLYVTKIIPICFIVPHTLSVFSHLSCITLCWHQIHLSVYRIPPCIVCFQLYLPPQTLLRSVSIIPYILHP